MNRSGAYGRFRNKLSNRYRNVIWAQEELSESDYRKTHRNLILSGATGNIIGLLTIGAFLTGYLQFLGASEQYIAIIAAIPQLGSILQIISPYIFEKMKSRKLLIIISCFLFRFSVSTIIFVPYLTENSVHRLILIFMIYTFAFLVAGFVTPGLDHWNLRMAPEKGRGSFLAKKDIFSMISVSIVSITISRILDYYKAENAEMIGFTIMFTVALLVSLIDFYLISGIGEVKNEVHETSKTLMETILIPLQDKKFRGMILFLCVWNFAMQLSMAFIPIFMINYLELSYYFISLVGVIANLAGMVSIYLWGKFADSNSWSKMLKISGAIMTICFAGWFLASGRYVKAMVVIIQMLMMSSRGAFLMASNNILYTTSPKIGKTAYFGVASAFAYVISFSGGILGSFLSIYLKNIKVQIFGNMIVGIQFLFLITGILLGIALIIFRIQDKSVKKEKGHKIGG